MSRSRASKVYSPEDQAVTKEQEVFQEERIEELALQIHELEKGHVETIVQMENSLQEL